MNMLVLNGVQIERKCCNIPNLLPLYYIGPHTPLKTNICWLTYWLVLLTLNSYLYLHSLYVRPFSF
jgi:hypothetical protein